MHLTELIKKTNIQRFHTNHLIAVGLLLVSVTGLAYFPGGDQGSMAAARADLTTPRSQSLTGLRNDLSLDGHPSPTYPLSEDGPQLPGDGWIHREVRAGDTLSELFRQVGLSDKEIYLLLESGEEAKILNRIYPGYQLYFDIPIPGQLEQFKVFRSPLEGYLFTLVDGFFDLELIHRTPEIRTSYKHGSITDSLFVAGQRAKIPTVTIMDMANIFGGMIDFILDPRIDDDFSIMFEEKYLDGEFIGTGDILVAQFTNQGQRYVAIRYIDEDGIVGYYNLEGESMRKAFLRTPLDVFRISSTFSLARRHPILNTIRAHRGIDYAAPNGTPVRATSDGTISFAARNGSFGKLVVIKHGDGFETKYAHLSNYANGIGKGVKVRQGDIIGYVGATGSATGPHLHYEFLVNGEHRNPSTVVEQLPKAESLDADQLARFRAQSEELLARFNGFENIRRFTLSQHSAE